MALAEERIQRSLARVCSSDGVTLGTAFFVLSEGGVVLTCHHLVEISERVRLDCGDGYSREGVIAASDRFPEIDLAIIRCTDGLPPHALPIESDRRGVTHFWTKGFHYYGKDITSSLPANGTIIGVTDIQFVTLRGDYRLNGVLVLKDDRFDAGLSGAPILDPDTGVVFAIINAKFQGNGLLAGFALPLSCAREYSPALGKIFDANRESVPRYGRFLNYQGAAELCRRQREVIIKRLVSSESFYSELYCERELEKVICQFFKSDSFVLPIIGNAGVGKTTLLAELARGTVQQDIMLVLGRDIREDEPDLAATITSQLREAAADQFGIEGTVSVLTATLRDKGQRLIVLLDGLNEVPLLSSKTLETWIERTVSNSRSALKILYELCWRVLPRAI